MVFVGDVDPDTAAPLGAEFRYTTTRLAERFEDLEGTEITAHIHADVETHCTPPTRGDTSRFLTGSSAATGLVP